MSPRPYHLGKRQASIDDGRRRILDAARALLSEPTGYPGFTVESVARRADVARATVYYQFRSKSGLLEAVCDDLAEAGGIADLARVFAEPDAEEALRGFIGAFGRFWSADRLVLRRLRALAVLDADVGAVIAARDQRRRDGLRILAGRLAGDGAGAREDREDREDPEDPEDAVRLLQALTSFETFDCIAGADRDPAAAVPFVAGLARCALGIADRGRGKAGP